MSGEEEIKRKLDDAETDSQSKKSAKLEYIKVEPYLYFNGNAREALDFYSNALKTDSKTIRTYGDDPHALVPEDRKDKIMHATINLEGNANIMLADYYPEKDPLVVGGNISLSVFIENAQRVREIYDALAVGGDAYMPLGPVPWGGSYGQVKDKFGVNWMFSTN